MRSTEEIIDDVVNDEYEPEPSTVDVIVGAWREALAADGIERVVLVGLVASTTVVPLALFVLMILGMLDLVTLNTGGW